MSGAGGWGKMRLVQSKGTTASFKVNKFCDLMYSVVMIMTNNVLYSGKLLREKALKVINSTTQKSALTSGRD